MHKIKHLGLIGFFISFLAIFLSGCSVKKVMSTEQLNVQFDQLQKALIVGQNTVIKGSKKSSSLKLDSTDTNNLDEAKAQTSSVIQKLNQTNTRMGFPSQVNSLASETKDYLSEIKSGSNVSKLNKKYHKLVNQGISIYRSLPDKEKKNSSEKLILTTISLDKFQKYDSQNSSKKSKTTSQAKLTEGDLNPISFKSKKPISNLAYVTIIILCVLIIISVFLQPSKANDNMNALNDAAGNSLMSQAKPHGATLFMLRLTTSLIILLALILLVIQL